MHAARKAALLWSGGKDSALALHHARQGHPDLRVEKLVTCVSQAYDRVSMHGVRRRLVEDQGDALGLPVEFVVVPSHPDASCPMAHSTPGTDFLPDDVYSRTILAALGRLEGEGGVEVVVFGDIMCFGFLGVTTEGPGPVGFRLTRGGPVLYRPGTLPSSSAPGKAGTARKKEPELARGSR
jgi:hypothetical protein